MSTNTSNLAITNVVTVSVATAQTGVGAFNTSNLALFTHEYPSQATFPVSAGYGIYLSPTQVATDFGTGSETYAMANAIFAQQPNILAGGGYLVIIPYIAEVVNLAFSAVAASGTFIVNYGGHASAAVNWNDSAGTIQTTLRAVQGLSNVVVTGSIASQSLNIAMNGIYAPTAVTTSSDTLQTAGSAGITITVSIGTAQETFGTAITRTQGLVSYFGVMPAEVLSTADVQAAAAIVQALQIIAFTVSITSTDVSSAGGMGGLITAAGQTQMRVLYYGGATDPLVFMASYAALGLSTNFNGSNTTQTLHLKGLTGVLPDSSMTQSLLTAAGTNGVDVYVSIQGIAKIFCSGANQFYDQVYNLLWFAATIQVAVFNYLATTNTKIPQTEQGMDGLKGAIRNVCEQAVTNQYLAPGSWNSSTSFGNQANFLANISQRGYYIYSAPISTQTQTARAARQAPLCQVAAKQAGATHSSAIAIYVNA